MVIYQLSKQKKSFQYIGLEQKFVAFLALKFLYFTKLVWHHLIEQNFSFQNLFFQIQYD